MKTRLIFSALAVPLLLGSAALLSGARVSVFDVSKEGNDLVIQWQAELEDDVREYELQRRTPYSNDQFVRIHATAAHGAGKMYRFRDDQVYKNASDMVDYRLDVVYGDGSREIGVRTHSINYTSTAVRRTWGSIKAMFQ